MKLFIYLQIIGLISCQSPSEKIVEDFRTVEKSLDKSNGNIEDANKQLAAALQNNSALQVFKKEADSIVAYIEAVKEMIRMVSGRVDNFDTADNSANLFASNRVMLANKKADTIFRILKDFKNSALLNCKKDTLKEMINLRFQYLKDEKRQAVYFFKNTPAVAAVTMLSKFENDVKEVENMILTNYLSKNN